MTKIIYLSILCSLLMPKLKAQSLSLEQCMRYAIEHNTAVGKQISDNKNRKQNRVESFASFFPSVNADAGLNTAYGRSIDPETNTYTHMGNISNRYGVDAFMTIFDGLKSIHAHKASKVSVQLGKEKLQQIKDEKALLVMQLYFDALYYQETTLIIQDQLQTSKELLHFAEKQMELGLKSPADVALNNAQVANDALLLTQQRGRYNSVMLDLKEAMNYNLYDSLFILPVQDYSDTLSDPSCHLNSNPELRVAKLHLDQSCLDLKIARGGYAPRIALGAGINTNFYARLDDKFTRDIYATRLKENYGYYFGATISFPLFNGLRHRSNVVRAINNKRIAQYAYEEASLKVRKAIRAAEIEQQNAIDEQNSAGQKIKANQLAFQAMQMKYKKGLISFVDLQKSQNDFMLAQAEYLRAKLNFQIQSRMLAYYRGIPLVSAQ